MNRNCLVDTYMYSEWMLFCVLRKNFCLMTYMLSKYTRNFLLVLYDFGKWLQMQTWLLLKYDPHQPYCWCGFLQCSFPLACKSNLQTSSFLIWCTFKDLFCCCDMLEIPSILCTYLFFTYLLHQKVTTSHIKRFVNALYKKKTYSTTPN